MTSVTFMIEIDGEVGNWLTFEADFVGDPASGFELKSATLIEHTLFLDDESEESATLNVDKTEWLRGWIRDNKAGLNIAVTLELGRYTTLETMLIEKWQNENLY